MRTNHAAAFIIALLSTCLIKHYTHIQDSNQDAPFLFGTNGPTVHFCDSTSVSALLILVCVLGGGRCRRRRQSQQGNTKSSSSSFAQSGESLYSLAMAPTSVLSANVSVSSPRSVMSGGGRKLLDLEEGLERFLSLISLPDWMAVVDDSALEIRVSTKGGSMVKLEATLPAPPTIAHQYLMFGPRQEWDDLCEHYTLETQQQSGDDSLLGGYGDGDLSGGGATLHHSYYRSKSYWPVAARDFYARIYTKQLPDGSMVSIAQSPNDSTIVGGLSNCSPPGGIAKGVVRMRVNLQGYLLIPHTHNQCKMIMINDLDFGGYIPTSLVRYALSNSVPMMVGTVRDKLEARMAKEKEGELGEDQTRLIFASLERINHRLDVIEKRLEATETVAQDVWWWARWSPVVVAAAGGAAAVYYYYYHYHYYAAAAANHANAIPEKATPSTSTNYSSSWLKHFV